MHGNWIYDEKFWLSDNVLVPDSDRIYVILVRSFNYEGASKE